MRAREPDTTGFIQRDGYKIGYEVFGDGAPTLLLLPTWQIVSSRFWKAQVAYLARRFRVVADFAYKKRAGRREYVRASLEQAGPGPARARRYHKEGAGMITSLTETDGLVELPEATIRLEPGTEVDFLPYSELV